MFSRVRYLATLLRKNKKTVLKRSLSSSSSSQPLSSHPLSSSSSSSSSSASIPSSATSSIPSSSSTSTSSCSSSSNKKYLTKSIACALGCTGVATTFWFLLEPQKEEEEKISELPKPPNPSRPKIAPVTLNIKSSSDIPNECARMAQLIAKQNYFDGKGLFCFGSQTQILPFQKWEDVRIFQLVNDGAKKILSKKKQWMLSAFGYHHSDVYDNEGKRIEQGIYLSVYPNNEKCSLKILQKTYEKVIYETCTGWVRSDPQSPKNKNILFKEDPLQFDLFIKPKPFFTDESCLIRFIASRLSIDRNDITCHNDWIKSSGSGLNQGMSYLWVRKTKTDEIVNNFLQLQIDDEPYNELEMILMFL